ncbi:N-acetyltransferase [Hymenobacter sediminis]|uniref:GNAT family N-acetyltransferase n=1 Tax=Hymenobacter sediminis TaxID=2218621 RepID=UPI000DA6684C|nr:N-acetyltransferase [Hymenobacter sediminis]
MECLGQPAPPLSCYPNRLRAGPAKTKLQATDALEIKRIAVLQAYHGQKVGQRLYNQAIQLAQQAQAADVWLGVWEEDPRAIRLYEKKGFVAFR